MNTGQYYDLLNRGFIKVEDREPCIDGMEFYLDAFRELSTSRPGGMEIQSIPFTAIAEYFRIYELSDFDEFAYIVRLMDRTFLEENDAAQKSKGDKDGGNNTDKNNKNKG